MVLLGGGSLVAVGVLYDGQASQRLLGTVQLFSCKSLHTDRTSAAATAEAVLPRLC